MFTFFSYSIQNNKNDVIPLYQKVIKLARALNENDNIGLVVGANQIDVMKTIRQFSEGLSWLVPGVGAQGGDLQKSVSLSNQNDVGVISISRGILYAGSGSIDDIIKSAYQYTEQIRGIVCNP